MWRYVVKESNLIIGRVKRLGHSFGVACVLCVDMYGLEDLTNIIS